MDPFTALVSQAREQGEARDKLIARHVAMLPPVPRDVSVPTYAKGLHWREDAPFEARAGSTDKRRKLRAWTRRYVGWLITTHTTVGKAARPTLTADARWLIGQVRDSIVREGLPYDKRAGRTYRLETAEQGYDPSPWKGMVNARETRVNGRGAHGDKRVKVGSHAARVSVRDTHKAPYLLLPLNVVGVATHPDASDADYVALIETVRRHPTWATLTRRMPGPHGYSSLLTYVDPVSWYTHKDEEGHPGYSVKVKADSATSTSTVPEVLRLAQAGKLSYLGNVE